MAHADHTRDPCPWVILSDFGGAFAMGAIGGGIWHGIKGARNSPRGERLVGAVSVIKARAPVTGGNFGVWGGMFSTFDCAVKGYRQKEDAWNAIISGFMTGGCLAARIPSSDTNGSSSNRSKEKGKVLGETELLQSAQTVVSSLVRLHHSGARSNELKRFGTAAKSLLQTGNGEPVKVRISVYGPDEPSTARNLVTALLDDPLSSDENLRNFIQDRYNDSGSRITEEVQRFESSPSTEGTQAVSIPSPFLTRFKSPIVLEELSTSSPGEPSAATAHLLTTDIPIVVRTPFIPPSPSYSPKLFQRNLNTLLVIDYPFDSNSPSALLVTSRLAAAYGVTASNILFFDSARALRGLATLRKDGGSARAVQQYQEDILGAQLPALHRALEDAVARGKGQLHKDAMRALTGSIVATGLSMLRTRALEEKEKALAEILGGNVGVKEGEKGEVVRAVEMVAEDVKPTLDGLRWWRLPFAVDDVSTRVDRAVERAYTNEFEGALVFHTGRLSKLQLQLVSQTASFLTSLPPSFHSPILHNALAQLTSAPSFTIGPSALLGPLQTRTAQLAHATRTLHLSAQRLLLTTFFFTSLSSIGSYSLWLANVLDAPTAAGGAALVVLAGVRWAVGRWERARRAWWADFDRVGAGLERDLRTKLDGVLEKQVCAMSQKACHGLESIVERRKDEIATVEEEVEGVEEALQSDLRTKDELSEFLQSEKVEKK
ncbi:hypothetical protein EW145_g3013 [Phellinidium pouzarii]|uniref:Mmc1 C-terminal domain-containing protein n=1 Tax=Phellinidium pouzarii TaxID=167371 RepID=A0A4S4L954_9AGAM|nr:hypothetical protein EW145_g3013 [Phellinidium pouzarii]